MWLNQLFTDSPVDFGRRCAMRVKVGVGIAVLGALSIGIGAFFPGGIPMLALEEGAWEAIPGIYEGLGFGLMAGGIVSALRNLRYLRSPELRKKKEVEETDERNRLIGLRCWAYAGYTMFLILYVGVMAGGFISMTVLKTLLAVAAVYSILLLAFRMVLNRTM